MSYPFGKERRARPRVEQPFPATLRGVDAMGEPMGIDTVLDNISANGLFVRIPRPIEPGATLAVGIRLSVAGPEEGGARVATRGLVKRVELTADGQYGIAVEFVRYRVF